MEYGELPVFVFEDAHQPLLPSWVVTCITINVIMGSGFLGVPSAFLSSGPLLGALVLLVVSVLMWIAACYLAQVASRAHALLVDEKSAATLTPTLTPLSALNNAIAEKPGEMPSLLIPSHTSYEIPMLCRLYLGRWVERFVMISLGLFQLGSLWSYASVFASSMAAIVPLPGLLGEEQSMEPCDIYKTDTYGGGCITLYYFWALSFAVAMVALLGLDVREQAYMQCFMTLLRAVILAVMVGTLLFGSRSDFGLSSSPDQTAAGPPAVRWDGLPRVVLTSVFCQYVGHHRISSHDPTLTPHAAPSHPCVQATQSHSSPLLPSLLYAPILPIRPRNFYLRTPTLGSFPPSLLLPSPPLSSHLLSGVFRWASPRCSSHSAAKQISPR